MISLRKKLRLLLLVFLLPCALMAETIYLKNGGVVNGTIVGQTRTEVRIRTAQGVQVIQKDDIRRIVYGNEEAERLAREAELRRQQEAERLRQEELQRQQEEEAARQAEAERQRQAEEAQRREVEQRARRENQGPIVRNAFFRSLILPGWGQAYQGRSGAAWGFGLGFAATLGVSLYADDLHDRYRTAYTNSADRFFLTSPLVLSFLGVTITDTTPFIASGLVQLNDTGALRDRQELSGDFANGMRTALLALYVWNLVDVVIFHPDSTQSVNLRTSGDQLGLSYQLRY
ncbi:MAG: hypothetical protein H7A22_03645 [Spirochaetales bacterium]|nr:hypothetical protein [Spirochaetales bacterium]